MEKELTTQNWNAVSEIELVYKSKVKASERPRLKSIDSVHQFLRAHWDENKIEFVEQFKLILMNTAHRVLGLINLSTGGVSGTVVDPKLVFIHALKLNANRIILAHNHPSSNLEPSEADLGITKQLIAGGKLLDIKVIDHIIITAEDFISFSNEGLL